MRETATMPWRVYRPSIVVGDSKNGRIDKIDGPYYFFPLLKRAHRLMPDWLPLIGPELGNTNLVPGRLRRRRARPHRPPAGASTGRRST